MTTLITGATGFVGAAVARRVLAEGRPVRVLARHGSDRSNIKGLDVAVVEGDLTDAASLAEAVRGCKSVFHVAADYRIWCPDPAAMMATNVEGSRALMRAAAEAGVQRAVYTSSVATIMPHADGTPADENTPSSVDNMIGSYKRSKYLAEQVVLAVAEETGLEVVVVNPSTPVGPRDIRPTPTGRLIRDAAAGRVPAYVETGLNIVHVDDVADGHWLAHKRGNVGRRYILGGENMSLRKILSTVTRLAGRRPPTLQLPNPLAMGIAHMSEAVARLTGREPMATMDGVRMARHKMYFSSRRASDELGYAPRPAHEALADAVAWFSKGG